MAIKWSEKCAEMTRNRERRKMHPIDKAKKRKKKKSMLGLGGDVLGTEGQNNKREMPGEQRKEGRKEAG